MANQPVENWQRTAGVDNDGGRAHLMAWRSAPRLLQHRPALLRQVHVVQVHLRMRRCSLRMG